MSGREEDAPGSRVESVVGGKYRLTRLIGEGGMGEVYEAEHVIVGRRFAVKFLHRHLSHQGDALLRFRREARAAGALESEHIASVVDFDTSPDGAPFMVMEFLLGENLGQLLAREGQLPVPRAVSIALQVCRGLEAAHAAGIIHRDLKPDNLFSSRRADGSELVKILDFGIAKLASDEGSPALTRSGALMGTPFYMAPEQARGEKLLDERVDVYALGVILYELLSGKKPHPGDSHNSILAHILTEPVRPLDELRVGLPRGLSDVVARALSSSRDARPSTVTGLARELLPFAGREVLQIQSHFDLRPDIALQRTLPTPDTHSLSLPAPSAEHARRSFAPQRRSLVLSLAAALLGFGALAAWLDARRARDIGAAASSSLAPEPPRAEASSLERRPSAPLASPSHTAPSQASAAPAATSAAALMSAPTSRGRPSGRPTNPPKPLGRAIEAAREPRQDAPKEPVSKDNSASEAGAPRVHFDSANPYQ